MGMWINGKSKINKGLSGFNTLDNSSIPILHVRRLSTRLSSNWWMIVPTKQFD